MVTGYVGRMSPDSFTWSRWRQFGLFSKLGIACRQSDIMCFRGILSRHMIGWIEAERLSCRPKEKQFAVMFLEDDNFSWCHLTECEFLAVMDRMR